MKAYPNWFYPTLLISLLLLIVSGFLLVPTTLDMRFEYNVFWRLSGEQYQTDVATHTSFSYIILALIGALSTIHMRAGIRNKRNVRSGLTLLTCFIVLMASGIGLLYLGDEDAILFTSAVHILVGIALVAIFGLHFVNRQQK